MTDMDKYEQSELYYSVVWGILGSDLPSDSVIRVLSCYLLSQQTVILGRSVFNGMDDSNDMDKYWSYIVNHNAPDDYCKVDGIYEL